MHKFLECPPFSVYNFELSFLKIMLILTECIMVLNLLLLDFPELMAGSKLEQLNLKSL